MKELQFLEKINGILSDSSLLGDDCAYLEDFGLYITHDTLCENIHFDLKYTDFYTLAQKSVNVNISDLVSNLAIPKFISISLSIPSNFNSDFIADFYKGIEECCKTYNIKVCGGDITGSKSGLVISISALGKPFKNAPKTSRSFAKDGQYVCVTRDYGSSAYALYCLQNGFECPDDILNTHLLPKPDTDISKELSKLSCSAIAVMDSSDGLGDALFKIAKASKKSIDISFDKIPYNKEIEKYGENYKDLILWGGEDYGLVFCISEDDFKKINSNPKISIYKIGYVKPYKKDYYFKMDNILFDEEKILAKCYNHFKGALNE